jgi:hypothetical protein
MPFWDREETRGHGFRAPSGEAQPGRDFDVTLPDSRPRGARRRSPQREAAVAAVSRPGP